MNFFDKKHISKLEVLNRSYSNGWKLERLKYIYAFAERNFCNYLNLFNGIKIKYILFAEAPPWTESGVPKYFYSKIESKLHETFWQTFFDIPVPQNDGLGYRMLAKKKFLLIDSIPYALKYNSRIREKDIYEELISEYMNFNLSRIDNALEFDSDLKIAFAFDKNARTIISCTEESICLSNNEFQLSESQIASDGTGFPKPIWLKQKYELG